MHGLPTKGVQWLLGIVARPSKSKGFLNRREALKTFSQGVSIRVRWIYLPGHALVEALMLIAQPVRVTLGFSAFATAPKPYTLNPFLNPRPEALSLGNEALVHDLCALQGYRYVRVYPDPLKDPTTGLPPKKGFITALGRLGGY